MQPDQRHPDRDPCWNNNLNGVNLTGSILTGDAGSGEIQSRGNTGIPLALPTDWKLVKGYLVGPGAWLESANLSGADLTGANLTGANLTGAILTGAQLDDLPGANLTGVTSGDIAFSPYLPPDWLFANGYLIGREAILSGANLSGTVLTNAVLTGADLTYANLSYANLSYANLYFANLTGADLTGANLYGANLVGISTDATIQPLISQLTTALEATEAMNAQIHILT